MILRRYRNILLAAALLTVGCQSLDQAPLDETSELNFWNSEKETLYAVSGLYNGWEVGSQIFYMDCVSDNANSDFPWENFQALGNGTASPTNSGNADARYSYEHIRRANWILENIDKAPIGDALKDRLKGEIRTIRAYRYLDLVTLFGNVPIITETLEIEDSYLPAKPQDEVLAFVETELKAAADLLPVIQDEKGRMTKGAALGFLARCYAFQGKHQEVANTTQEIIDLDTYSLFKDYAGLFEEANENNSEVIADIQYVENIQGYTDLGIMLPNSLGGWSSIVPVQSLVDSYETIDGEPITISSSYDPTQPYKNRDPRFAATVIYPGARYGNKYFDPLDPNSIDFPLGQDNASSTGYNFRKYLQEPSAYANVWNVGTNIIVLRYAEILLLNAEAKIELGQIDNSVYEDIDLVRERAGMPKVDRTVYTSQSTLRDLVRRELRVELAGEGRRRFDIIRWGIAKEVMNGAVYGALSEGTVNAATGAVTFTSLDKRFFVENRVFTEGKNERWPIPQNVIDRAKGTLEQNPNY